MISKFPCKETIKLDRKKLLQRKQVSCKRIKDFRGFTFELTVKKTSWEYFYTTVSSPSPSALLTLISVKVIIFVKSY